MQETAVLVIGIVIAFIFGLFSAKKTSSKDAEVLDLTGKIKENKDAAAKLQKDADAKIKEYQDALKAYDPNFSSDDDGGKPAS